MYRGVSCKLDIKQIVTKPFDLENMKQNIDPITSLWIIMEDYFCIDIHGTAKTEGHGFEKCT